MAYSLNPEGAISGYYVDANDVYHGFLRSSGGAITSFNAPGAGTSSYQGTLASSNTTAMIAGSDIDASGVYHGFLLTQ